MRMSDWSSDVCSSDLHDGAAVFLQRARHDLRRRGRAPIDQHDDRQAVGQIAGCGVEALRVVGRAAARGNDLALVYEGVRYLDRLIEQATGVVAQVEHVAAQLAADFGLDRLDRLL